MTDRLPHRPVQRRHERELLAVALAISALWLAAAIPVAAADPSARRTPTSLGAPLASGPASVSSARRTVSFSVYRSGAAVLQYRSYWCVPAAAQTMLNLVLGRSDRTVATQSRLYTELRRANLYVYSTRGNDVRGWARVLNARSPTGLSYSDRSFTSRGAAIEALVSAMEATRRPAGNVVDHGSHAWTVVGYRYSQIARDRSSRVILGLEVIGPLGSPLDPWPKAYLTVSQLASSFTSYHEPTRPVIWEGKYVIVAPNDAIGAISISR